MDPDTSTKLAHEIAIAQLDGRLETEGFARVFVRANLPTFMTYALGTAAIFAFSPVAALAYALYCVASTMAMWATVCTNCPYYGRVCPCGYSAAASSLFKRGNPRLISTRYRLIWLYVAPAWLAPPLSAVPVLLFQFSWLLLFLLAAFLVMAFVVAPGLSKVVGCCSYWRGCEVEPSRPNDVTIQ